MDIDEPKLTHVVVDKRDTSRRVALIKRTSTFVSHFPLLFNSYECEVSDGDFVLGLNEGTSLLIASFKLV